MPPLKFKNPEGQIITVDSPDGSIPNEQELDQLFALAKTGNKVYTPEVVTTPKRRDISVAQKATDYIFPQILTNAQFAPGKMNLWGDLGERPGAAIRSAIMGQGYRQGAFNPQNAPNLSELAVQGYLQRAGNKANPIMGTLNAIGGEMLNMATQPLNWLTALVGSVPGADKAAQVIGQEVGRAGQLVKGITGTARQSSIGQVVQKGIGRVSRITPEAIKTIREIPDKFFRGGLTKPEALRMESQYGSSNGTLVETVKDKLKQVFSFADEAYDEVFNNTPENKFIDIRPAIEEAGKILKRIELITEKGNLTEFGQSEIASDSVYGKLLDFYKSADAISGVKKLQNIPLTQSQMIKASKAMRKTLVNKDQYIFLRNKINALYKGKHYKGGKSSNINVGRVADIFYQSGENSGLKGLQAARRLEREAFKKSDIFLDAKGDLKIATEAKLSRIGTDKPPSKQEMQHIIELQQYIKHPIIPDATKINKLNRAKEILKKAKERAVWGGVGAIGGGLVTRKLLGR